MTGWIRKKSLHMTQRNTKTQIDKAYQFTEMKDKQTNNLHKTLAQCRDVSVQTSIGYHQN